MYKCVSQKSKLEELLTVNPPITMAVQTKKSSLK